MKYVSILFLSLITVFGCSHPSPTETSTLEESLEEAYHSQSRTQLKAFFDQWHRSIAPKTNKKIAASSDTVQAAYEIYQDFYHPFTLLRYGYVEVGNGLYQEISYVIVQNELTIAFDETSTVVVEDFRPPVAFDGVKAVYLTDEYKDVFDKFLDGDLGWEELLKRMDFINTYTKIFPGHWFGWHYLTHPELYRLEMTSQMSQATARFRIGYEGGEAEFEIIGEQWKMMSAQLTWIE